MTQSRFFSLLAITVLVAVAMVTALHVTLPLSYAMPLTIGTLVIATVLTIGIYYIGKATASAENKFLFGNAFMGATMVKMFLFGGIIAAYIFFGNPVNQLYLLPFFLIYFTFTVFEIVFLVKLASETK